MKRQRLTALVLVVMACMFAACSESNMKFLSEKIEIAASPNLAEWIPRTAYNSQDDEFLVVWTEQGARVQGGALCTALLPSGFPQKGRK